MAGYATETQYMIPPHPLYRVPFLGARLIACDRHDRLLSSEKRNPGLLAEFGTGKFVGNSRAKYALYPAVKYCRHSAPPVGMYENNEVRGGDQPSLLLYNRVEAEATLHLCPLKDGLKVEFIQIFCMNTDTFGPQAIAHRVRCRSIQAVV